MPPTDTAVKRAKPGPKPIKLADGRGLFLLVNPGGSKLWRCKYRVLGKEKILSLGAYPDVSLAQAREGASVEGVAAKLQYQRHRSRVKAHYPTWSALSPGRVWRWPV